MQSIERYGVIALLFLVVSGEERGLLGSRWYAGHPTVPLDSVVALINLDMIGRNRPDSVFLNGWGKSEVAGEVVRQSHEHPDLGLQRTGTARLAVAPALGALDERDLAAAQAREPALRRALRQSVEDMDSGRRAGCNAWKEGRTHGLLSCRARPSLGCARFFGWVWKGVRLSHSLKACQ